MLGQLRTFDTLSDPAFRRLWPAVWLWYGCRWMEVTVLSWLVLELTDSASQVALVGVVQMLPMPLLGFAAGSLADRWPKKQVMLGVQAVNLLASLTMTALLFTRAVIPLHVFVYMFVTGAAWTVDFPARRSYYSGLFDETRLVNAMSLDSVAATGSSMLGPLLGGSLIALAGYSGTYAAVVTIYVIGFFLLLSVTGGADRTATRTTGHLATQLAEVARIVRVNRTIWAVLMVTIPMNLFGLSYRQVVPVIARDILGVGSALYGVLGASMGLGSLVGSLIIASRYVHRHGTLFSLGSILMLAALFSFALSSAYILSVALLFVAGLARSGFATMQSTIVLTASAPEMRGRAMGVLALAIGAMPAGIWTAGQLAELIGPQAALALLSGTGVLTVGLLRRRFPELRS